MAGLASLESASTGVDVAVEYPCKLCLGTIANDFALYSCNGEDEHLGLVVN